MRFAEKIFERATIKGIADYLLYGTIPEREERDYESRLDAADLAYERVAKHYDEDGASVLLSAANELVNENACVYMELGLQAGFLLLTDMFQNIQREKGCPADNQNACNKDGLKTAYPETKENTGKSVLQQFIRNRLDTALEETLRKDRKYQETKLDAQEKAGKLNEKMFTPEQWELVEDALEESNASASEYGRAAYQQGLMDTLDFLADVLLQGRRQP